jgi:tetratricopeptide (TPR) repeat protein
LLASQSIEKRIALSLFSIGLLLLAVLAVSRAVAAEENEAVAEAEPEDSRALVVFVDKPVPLVEGVEPQFPPVALVVEPANEVEDTAQLQSINQFNLSIQQHESDGGAWNSALFETLSGLGNLQQQLQNHTEALGTFDRAMQISRINNGLHTADQLPIVGEIIESHLAMGNWEQADIYYDYLFYIQHKAFGSSDPRIIPVLTELGKWNMRAFSIGFGDSLGLRLSTAQIAFNTAYRLLDAHFGRSDERFTPFLHNIASSAYQTAINPGLINDIDRPDYLMEQDDFRRLLNEEGSSVPRGFEPGEMALLEIIAFHEQAGSSPRQLAQAKADLADWYLIFGRRRDAETVYLETWNFLGEQENGTQLQQELFATAIPIPTYDSTPRLINYRGSERPDRGQLQADYGDFTFEVSRLGEVRRVQIADEETAENSGQLQRVARELRRNNFRPVLQDGVPVTTENNRVRVRFWY